MYDYYGEISTQVWVTYMTLRKMILGSNFTEIVIAKDLILPDENITILRWSDRMYRIVILEFR